MRQWFMAVVAVVLLTACEKVVVVYGGEEQQQTDGVCRVTFNVGGEFGDMTRAVAVGESNMTDLWVYDYVGGECKRSERQTSTQGGFGTVTMDFPLGSHTLYFVASRGVGADDGEDGTIVWATPGDTFWAKVELDVKYDMERTIAVRMKRVATCLTVAVQDVVPENMSRLSVTPVTWYCGLDYTTGEACGAVYDTERSVSVPASYVGKSGVSASFYGLSGAEEWTTDFSVTAFDSNDRSIGYAAVTDAPFMQNRVTRYSGWLFNYQAGFDVTLDDEWEERYDGTW